ncbi:hypothetical protein [Thermofilum sp.]|jgi:hypothetical protein|uniref:hypothetical protein n=2 Tax=Thermofilum sp. TaxID=1961369 RepID=UPI00258C6DC8|nr:hypothetical protein [Thermofilum sp.]
MRNGKALLLATVALLLVLIAVQAFALSGDNTGTGSKDAIDERGQGTTYRYGVLDNPDDPRLIVLGTGYWVAAPLSCGNYNWTTGDKFSIRLLQPYSYPAYAIGQSYYMVVGHYIYLYINNKYNKTIGGYAYPLQGPFYSLMYYGASTYEVQSWRNSNIKHLDVVPSNSFYDFQSSSRSEGSLTVYSGVFRLIQYTWFTFDLINTEGCPGDGGGGNPPTPPPPPPPSTATLTLQLYRVDQNGNSLGPASGVQVKVGDSTYTTDSQGRVSVQVQKGSTVSVQVSQTYFNNNWGRYTFSKWSDDNTQNPRSFTVSSSTTVTAYVYDERLVKVTWSPDTAGRVSVNGQPVFNGWTSWYRYGAQLTLQAVPTSGAFKKWQRGANGGQLADYSTSNPVTITVDNGYQFNALFDLIVTLQLGTMYLPGEGISTPWLENVSGWAWNGTWTLNVTELYPVKEHIAMILTDGSNVKVVDLPNGTSIKVYLPAGWKNNKYVKPVGQAKVTQIPPDKDTLAGTFPAVNVSGQTWYLVALAAWNPYKQPSGYDTSCWLSNGTTLAVYNLTYTYTFKNGTRVVFKEPVVVSSLKTSAMPIYSYGNMKQGLSLKVTVKWKYLPPARTGIQPNPPSSIVGVAVIGNTVYNGTLTDSNSTSKTFTATITDDTWTLYSKGVNSITASAYWLSSMGTPEGPVTLQDPAQLNIVYVMLSFVYTIQRNFDESKIYVDNP